MYGYLALKQAGQGWRSVLTGEEIHGMRLLTARVPAPSRRKEKTLFRRVRRAGIRLWEQGVNRVLVDVDFPAPLWEPLNEVGVFQVETENLCQSMAEKFVMAALEQRGIAPQKATVCLRGYCAAGAVHHTAVSLACQVSRLVIDCFSQGAALAQWLSQEYGLPLMEPDIIRADLTVSFSAERGEGDLRLYGETPDLGGLRLTPVDWELPPQLDALPLMAALYDCGRLGEVSVTGEELPAITEINFVKEEKKS